LSNRFLNGRAIFDRDVVHIHDVLAESDEEFGDAKSIRAETGWRTGLAVPMLRESRAIGSLSLVRMEIRPFTDREIALLQTFADQAVIAIENARLFLELEHRNAELQESNRQVTDALEQHTATAEVLRVIASSPTDALPVLEAIVHSAMRLIASPIAIIHILNQSHAGNYMVVPEARGGFTLALV